MRRSLLGVALAALTLAAGAAQAQGYGPALELDAARQVAAAAEAEARRTGVVGVSGSSPEDDGRIARAGAAALGPQPAPR